jgi:membrane protease YdiL (CAAX protease family)
MQTSDAEAQSRGAGGPSRGVALVAALTACSAPALVWLLDAQLPRADRVLWRTLAAEAFFAGLALLIARARGGALRERLGLDRGALGARSAAAGVIGALALSGALAFAVSQLEGGPGGSLARLDSAASGAAAESPWLLLIAFGVAPGVCEELLFRGAIQRGLETRVRGFSAVGSALAFALLHFDPVHGPAALALGLYLGVVARRGRTTWLAILGHSANNCAALPQLQPAFAPLRPDAWAEAALWLAVSGLALALLFRATRRRAGAAASPASD